MDPLHFNCLGYTTFGTFSKHNDCYVLLCPVKNSLFVISNNIFFVLSMEQTSLESQFYLLPPPSIFALPYTTHGILALCRTEE